MNIIKKIINWIKSLNKKAYSRGDYMDGVNQVASGTGGSFTTSFVEADLTAGVVSFLHSLGNQFNVVQVYDENNQVILPDEITATDENNTEIDLTSFSPITGTWNIVIG
jgi:hypothetical protein